MPGLFLVGIKKEEASFITLKSVFEVCLSRKIYRTKITLCEVAEVRGGKKLYEVDTLEFGYLEDAREWVIEAYNREPKKTISFATEATKEGMREEPEGDSRDFNLTLMNPDVQGLIEALYRLSHASFSQAFKGERDELHH